MMKEEMYDYDSEFVPYGLYVNLITMAGASNRYQRSYGATFNRN